MNHMQKAFAQATLDLLRNDERVVLMFAGSGIVDQSQFDEFKVSSPQRIVDVGISEQGAIGVASGLAITGKIPVFHTQSPFIVERAYEQLKIDFGYQKVQGNFVGLGGSLEFTFLGPTHNAPADVGILKLIPNMQIVVPGTVNEFKKLYLGCYSNELPTYYRLSRDTNRIDYDVTPNKAQVVKTGTKATIVAVGPMLQMVLDILGDEDVTILYYTTIKPFDYKTLQDNFTNNRVILFEPYFRGGLATDIMTALKGESVKMDFVGIPQKFYSDYGLFTQLQEELGFTHQKIKGQYMELLK